MPQPHQLRRIGPNYLEKGVLGRLGETSARPGLAEGAFVEEPDADGGVLMIGRDTWLGGEELPGEGGAGGADLVEEVVVLEGFGSGYFLYGGLYGFFDYCGSFG